MKYAADFVPSLGSALLFVTGGLLGSITTQILLPGASWESCQSLGVTAAAQTGTSPSAHSEIPVSTPCPSSPQHGCATSLAAAEIFAADKASSTCHMTRVNGTYNISSPFTGPPTPEVDAAWARYWPTWMFSVDEAAFKASQPQHPKEAVRFESGPHDGRYLATFEATHQMHCLYNLFRASYLDSYPDEKADYDHDPGKWHERVDHCVEILRQKIECLRSDRDTTLITYNWVKHKKGPTANFNVARACPAWDAMGRWGQRHEVTEVPVKGPNAVELSAIP
ncbi:hypothetical protein O9K51_10185 [Purpureocillium lavendulum]|uniref:Uncharacterized protein n=1 Tax=Purpureocillium lavendulum TaxID=1247861 RepID=A0AB34FCR6_9HYPO|nr:hypothetical protein O9K51_10185 [Purpureocillium lavendulum]